MSNFFNKGQIKNLSREDVAKGIRDFCIDLGIAFVCVMLLLQFVQPNRIYQESMFPTYTDRDMILVNKVAYKNAEPSHGDIIVFDSGNAERKRYIKRVIGVAGDHIEIRNGKVFVNNIEQNQSYTADGVTEGNVDLVVPEDECFVMGDNRAVSIDSRSSELGCVEYDKIIGKVMFTKRVVLNKEAE